MFAAKWEKPHMCVQFYKRAVSKFDKKSEFKQLNESFILSPTLILFYYDHYL